MHEFFFITKSQVLYNLTNAFIFYNKIDHYYLLLTIVLFVS